VAAPITRQKNQTGQEHVHKGRRWSKEREEKGRDRLPRKSNAHAKEWIQTFARGRAKRHENLKKEKAETSTADGP